MGSRPLPHRLPRATELAHRLAGERLAPGDLAVDATVGNGHDTLFLAECVGPAGRVVGFDVQEEAIRRTAERVAGRAQVELHRTGHENLADHVPAPARAIVFNLGYLPSGDKTVVTRPETTLAALDAALDRLAGNGIVTVTLYPGHEGGGEEAARVLDWAGRLDPARFQAARFGFLNLPNSPPSLLAVEPR